MRKLIALVCLAGLAVGASGCISVRVNKEVIRPITLTKNQRAQVERTIESLIEADNRGDVDGAVSTYHPETVWYPPGEDPIDSIDWIRDHYTELFATYDFDLDISVEDVAIVGDTAFARGKITGEMASREAGVDDYVADDWYEAILRQSNGQWKIWRLAWGPISKPQQAGATNGWYD